MLSFLVKYVIVMAILAFAVLLFVLLQPHFLSFPVPSELEKVSSELQSDKHGQKVQLTDESASDDQELVMSPHQRFPITRAKERELKKHSRLYVIEARLEQLAQLPTQDTASMLERLQLQEEMLQLQKELGLLVVEGGDPFLSNKIGQLILSNMTSDKRIPVSVGEQVVDLLVESGKIGDAATVYMATQRATESGDPFFKAAHWAAWDTDTPGASVDSTVPTDPCCPDEITPVRVADTHNDQPPTLTTLSAQTEGSESVETTSDKLLSLERFNQARTLIDQHGTEEGLRRFREMDPDAARRFERERRGEPSREVPSRDTHPDGHDAP